MNYKFLFYSVIAILIFFGIATVFPYVMAGAYVYGWGTTLYILMMSIGSMVVPIFVIGGIIWLVWEFTKKKKD